VTQLAFQRVRGDPIAAIIYQIKSKEAPTNIAEIRHLSPFRYPGGKTWLVPEVRKWLTASSHAASVFVEPFAGGAMAGLSVAHERLAREVYLCELDDDVAAVWSLIFQGSESDARWLCERIRGFDVTLANVRQILDGTCASVRHQAFRTIVKNRMQRGGIMSAGAGLMKDGEAGRGLSSRWYPATIVERIKELRTLRDRITFEHGDAFDVIKRFAKDAHAFYFVDPPYTAGGKSAGTRLYRHNEVDHDRLFSTMAAVRGSVMLTYDDAPEVRDLAKLHGFRVVPVPMKSNHHAVVHELLILNDCGCQHHTVPHWLWMDRVWREMNRGMLKPMTPEAIHGCALEEVARLRDKRQQMERLGITEIPAEVIERCEREVRAAPRHWAEQRSAAIERESKRLNDDILAPAICCDRVDAG